MLSDLKKEIRARAAKRIFIQEEKNNLESELSILNTERGQLNKAMVVMRKAAKMSQEHIAVHLSGIVTKAIRSVINKPYEFHIEFVERRGVTEADLYVTLNEKRISILGSTGGGLADVCSYALKISYLLLSSNDRVLFLDEAARHVNSQWQREAFATVIKTLSREFDIQLIINTTIPELLDIADQIITVTQVNGVSSCQSIETSR